MSKVINLDMLIIRHRGINYQWFCIPCWEGSGSASSDDIKEVLNDLKLHLETKNHQLLEKEWMEDWI